MKRLIVCCLLGMLGCGGGGSGSSEPPPAFQTFKFAREGQITLLLEESVTNLASGPGTGAVTYRSSDPSVVQVDETRGTATAISQGSVSIMATQAASGQHPQVETHYVISARTADTLSAWIMDFLSFVALPLSADGMTFVRARMFDCPASESILMCPSAERSVSGTGEIREGRATLTTPAYYALANGANVGSVVEVQLERFSGRRAHRAVSFNNRYWVFGGVGPQSQQTSAERNAEVWSSSSGTTWRLETASAAFGPRSGHQALVLDGAVYILGGYKNNPADVAGVQEVWRSTDAINWSQVAVTNTAPFTDGGSEHDPAFLAATVFNSQLWIVRSGRVYSSADGADWVLRGSLGDLAPREFASLTVHDGQLWYMGGARVSDLGGTLVREPLSDVWRSADGVDWVQVNATASFAPRSDHAAFALGGRLWVLGGDLHSGGNENADTWSTVDGVSWRQEPIAAGVDNMRGAAIVQHADRVTLIAGDHFGQSNKVWQSTDGQVWKELSPSDFTPRESPALVVFKSQLWMLGGATMDGIVTNEVRRSGDGVIWLHARPVGATFQARTRHRAAVFAERIWVVGGVDNSATPITRFNDVWSTADGVTWVRHPDAPFSARAGHAMTVHNERLWVIGGDTSNGVASDVWSTSDGESWIQETAQADFHERRDHGVASHNGFIWLIGGTDAPLDQIGTGNDEVWQSSDGRAWTQVQASARFSPRLGMGVIKQFGGMFVIGGLASESTSSIESDVWHTDDGITWRKQEQLSSLPGRAHFGVADFQQGLYVAGGVADAPLNDVWRSFDAGVHWSAAFNHKIAGP